MARRDLCLVLAGALGATLLSYFYRRGTERISPRDKEKQASASQSSGKSHKEETGGADKGKCHQTHLVESEVLRKFTAAVFERCGCTKDDANTAAATLVLADLRGIDSHGVARLKAYYNMLKSGTINARPNITIVRETPSTAVMDGDNGLGLIVASRANALAIRKAAEVGSGWVSVRNTNHYGIAGTYPLKCAVEDMIGISMTNTSSVVAPLWGKERMLGTNPIAIAFPGTDKSRPMVIDFATSVVPFGKVEECARTGSQLSRGWAMDMDGEDAIEPESVMRNGALRPLGGDRSHGGHKGYCLSAMVDILSAVLSGGNWGPFAGAFTTNDVNTGGNSARAPSRGDMGNGMRGIGHFFGAMRIDGFRDVEGFKSSMDQWMSTFRSCEPVNPRQPVLVPGDPEWSAMDRRTKDGIPVKISVLGDLLDVANDLDMEPPFDVSAFDLSTVKKLHVQL